ncbi:hypothetical protein HHI36_006109, partial [Cryptolaemus montrouzieri]
MMAAKRMHDDEVFQKADNKSRAVWNIINGNLCGQSESKNENLEIVMNEQLVRDPALLSEHFN